VLVGAGWVVCAVLFGRRWTFPLVTSPLPVDYAARLSTTWPTAVEVFGSAVGGPGGVVGRIDPRARNASTPASVAP